MPTDLEARARVALDVARRHHMSAWERILRDHRSHDSFCPQTWAHSREWGFSCACSGEEQDWRISVVSLRNQIPEVIETMRRLYAQHQTSRNRKASRAEQRSRVLLNHCLTRQQRQELKKTDAFTMTGTDGQTYRITKGPCNNVKLVVDGEVTTSYCVVFKGQQTLPAFDLMLAQKLFLETNAEGFKALAYVYGPRGGAPLRRPLDEETIPPEEIPEEAVEDPRAWMQERLTA